MIRRMVALAAIGAAVSACAAMGSPRHPPSPSAAAKPAPTPTVPRTRCAPGTPCAPKSLSPLRQYYDAHHRRYYYYDPIKRAYYWEDGQPKS